MLLSLPCAPAVNRPLHLLTPRRRCAAKHQSALMNPAKVPAQPRLGIGLRLAAGRTFRCGSALPHLPPQAAGSLRRAVCSQSEGEDSDTQQLTKHVRWH